MAPTSTSPSGEVRDSKGGWITEDYVRRAAEYAPATFTAAGNH